jgi:hypothetical protein
MSTPLSATRFLAALKEAGLKVVEVGDWSTHNRNHKGPWGPVHGVMMHHTVTKGTQISVQICRDGHSALPGPLCHGVIDKDGTVYLVGYGRCNHAGLGDPDVLKAVISESVLPTDNEATTDGNRSFYGFECVNLGNGEDPWPQVQVEAMEKVAAALCREHGWSERSVIAHKEWQPGKPDPSGPGFPSMAEFRTVVGELLEPDQKPPAKPKPPVALPPPKRPVVDLSRLVAAAKSDPSKAGTPVSYSGVKTVEAALVNEGLLAKKRLDGHYGTDTKNAMSSWQERCGYRGRGPGQAADGIPGWDTLTKLGKKHGFDVVR